MPSRVKAKRCKTCKHSTSHGPEQHLPVCYVHVMRDKARLDQALLEAAGYVRVGLYWRALQHAEIEIRQIVDARTIYSRRDEPEAPGHIMVSYAPEWAVLIAGLHKQGDPDGHLVKRKVRVDLLKTLSLDLTAQKILMAQARLGGEEAGYTYLNSYLQKSYAHRRARNGTEHRTGHERR